jgi:hypothetical protein
MGLFRRRRVLPPLPADPAPAWPTVPPPAVVSAPYRAPAAPEAPTEAAVEATPEPLRVPPFPPDRVVLPLPDAAPVDDPADELLALGVELPAHLAPRDEVPGVRLWSMPVREPYEAAAAWLAIRAAHPRTGWWPIIAAEGLLDACDGGQDEVSGGAAVDTADSDLDGARWLARRLDWLSAGDPGFEIPRGPRPPLEDYSDGGFDWADALAAADSGEIVELILVPAAAGWLVPGVLGWSGAINHEMDGAQHAPVLRRWAAARWEAELVGLGLGTATLRVGDLPSAPQDALDLALEAMLYCSDIVFQGYRTIDALTEMIASHYGISGGIERSARG